MKFSVDNKKIIKNTIALYFRMGITMVVSFFTARVTLEQLGVEDYGLNNLVSSVVSMLTFLNGSMGTAVQRYFSIEIGRKNEQGLSKVFSVGLSLHAIVALITFALAEIFAVFFFHKMNVPVERMFAAKCVLQISIVSLIISIVNVPYAALLRAREMFSKTAMIEVVQSLLRLGVLYLLVSFQYDKLIVLSVLNFGVTLFYNGSFFVLARKFNEARVGFGWDIPLVKEMLGFISMLVLTVLAQLLKVQGLVFLINLFYGLAVNAAYAIAVQVSNVLNNFIASFKQSIVPQLMASYGAGDLKSMHGLINFGTKISFLLLMIASVPVIFNADFLLTVWLKNPPEYASELVALVLLYINISTFSYFLYQGVHATGKIVKQQIWMSSLYFLNVVLIFIAFELGASFYSALYINMIVSAIQIIINLYYAHRQYEYSCKYFIASLLLPCVVSFVMVSVVSLAIRHIHMSPALCFVVNLIAAFVVSCLLGLLVVMNRDEREKILNILKKKFGKKHA